MHNRLVKNFWLTLISTVVIAIAISVFTATTAAPNFYYSVTDLGSLSADFPVTQPRRINNLGQVIGSSRTTNSFPKPSQRAFLWQNGNMTNLGTLGGYMSEAYDINNSGQVVGKSLTSSGLYHAFLWQNGKMNDLKTYGNDNSSIATGINNNGQIVGASYQASIQNPEVSNGSDHALLWQNASITNLGFLSGDNFSKAFTINNQGQIFGWSGNTSNSATTHIFRWKNGVMNNLGNLVTPSGYIGSYVNGINNKGQVVGASYSNSGNSFKTAAVVWQKGTLTNLNDIAGRSSEALDINIAGTVVGYSSISNAFQALVWRNGKMRNLNNFLLPNSGWELNYANGINDKGQIVGIGTFNGQNRAFLLTPVTVSN